MRITARQLRQIIKEELDRNMSEEDETAHVKMPMSDADPSKKRSIFGPRAPSPEEAAWNAAWSELSQGEKDIFVACVKKDPNLPKIAGGVVRSGQFESDRFMNVLRTPYPRGGSQEFYDVVVKSGWSPRGVEVDEPSEKRARLTQMVNSFIFQSEGGGRARLEALRDAGHGGLTMQSSKLDRFVADHAELVVVLEGVFNQYFEMKNDGDNIEVPDAGTKLYDFVVTAMGMGA